MRWGEDKDSAAGNAGPPTAYLSPFISGETSPATIPPAVESGEPKLPVASAGMGWRRRSASGTRPNVASSAPSVAVLVGREGKGGRDHRQRGVVVDLARFRASRG